MEFKAHFYNHNQSFKYWKKSNATKLSKDFCQAKDARRKPAWNAASRPVQPQINRGQGSAIRAASQANWQFYARIQTQPLTKDGTQREMSSCERI